MPARFCGGSPRKAFRRPVDEATLERLTDLAMAESTFERRHRKRAAGDSHVAAVLVPHGAAAAAGRSRVAAPTRRLRARVAAFVLAVAEPAGRGADETGRRRRAPRRISPEQVRRMLADPKSSRFFEDFAGQWLRTRNVLMTPISRRDDDINPVRGRDEAGNRHAVRAHRPRRSRPARAGDGRLHVPRRAAGAVLRHPGEHGDEFRQVELPAESHRGGILTHGSFLVSTSNPDRTSPVKRGLFVLENLLATQPPPPPANVPSLEDAKVEGKTPRDRARAARSAPSRPRLCRLPCAFRSDRHRAGELRRDRPMARGRTRCRHRPVGDDGHRRGAVGNR